MTMRANKCPYPSVIIPIGTCALIIFYGLVIDMAKAQFQNLICIFIVIFFVFILYQFVYTKKQSPFINDIWVVNLDKDTKRYAYFMNMAKHLPAQINRWPATDGRTETRASASKEGVSTFLTKSMNNEEVQKSNVILFKPGVIGCWLSHKRLLRHLSSLKVDNQYGHFIVEDDIIVPFDFSKKWESLRHTIPTDWDIVYLGIGGAHGNKIHQNVLQWRNDIYSANWGTYAYLVRHGALPFILSKLQFMDSPIDVQFYRHFSPLNIYILDPPLITTGELESTIGQR